MTDHILAAQSFKNNAELIEAAARMGYLQKHWKILDATYGQGAFWRRWQPGGLVTNDLNPSINADHHADFRKLEFSDDHFDAAVFDPPYVSQGGRTTTTVPSFTGAYGLDDAPQTPAWVQDLIYDGLKELKRVVKPGGFILVKCKNYISSGTYFPGALFTATDGLDLGLTIETQFIYVTSGVVGMKPAEEQKHPANNYSVLIVFRVPK